MVIGVTGHRPQRLKKFVEIAEVTDWLDLQFQQYDEFRLISGMAQGVDQIAALEGLHFGGRLWCYFPYKRKLSEYEDYLTTKADKIVYEQEGYSSDCYIRRDRRIVDDCDILLAVWDGKKNGGTYQTIEYAKKQGKQIVYFEKKGKR